MSPGYVGWRLLQVAPVVAGIVVLGFLLIHLAPGDPVLALAGDAGDAEYYAAMHERFGLDQPWYRQLGTYVANVARGDLGVSYTHGRPALDVIVERVPATLLLAVMALAISSVVGVGLGMLAAARAGRFTDIAVSTVALGFYAAPVFWIGQVGLLLFALHLGWVPVQGMASAGSELDGLARVADVARHLALPVLVLASQEVAATARLTRASMTEELREPYATTVRAKGVGPVRLLVRHTLRRSLLPVVTLIGGRVGHLLSGAVVVEVVFGWPGLGRLLLTAMQTRNSPILLGIFLLVALCVVLANLLTDLAYRWLDPRITFSRA